MNKTSKVLILVVGLILIAVVIAGFSLFGERASLPASSGYGPNPELPAPDQRLIPVVNPPNALGWADGEKPVAVEGMVVTAFASGLDHPRWLIEMIFETMGGSPRGKNVWGWKVSLEKAADEKLSELGMHIIAPETVQAVASMEAI